VLGAWCLVLGAWCLVLGAWCLVLGAWCLEGARILANPATVAGLARVQGTREGWLGEGARILANPATGCSGDPGR
jgi:hypothetical protein